MARIQDFVNQMTYWCNLTNPGLGYDQTNRWDLRNGGSVDCSSLVISCLKLAGFATGNATYTGNMRSALTANGWVSVPNNGNPQVGDICLNDGEHVAVCVAPGKLAWASENEFNGATGGQPGDQTGRETLVGNYYNFPWNSYLRYTGTQSEGATNVQPAPAPNTGKTNFWFTVTNPLGANVRTAPSTSAPTVDNKFLSQGAVVAGDSIVVGGSGTANGKTSNQWVKTAVSGLYVNVANTNLEASGSAPVAPLQNDYGFTGATRKAITLAAGINVRTQPNTTSGLAAVRGTTNPLPGGLTIDIVGIVSGQQISQNNRSTNQWAKTISGGYVSLAWLDPR